MGVFVDGIMKMGDIINTEPAKYSKTDTAEADTLAIFNYIINKERIKPYLQQRDKTPNYDGYLEITKENQTPIGKIEVQIKKLNKKNENNPKYQCDFSLLLSILPFKCLTA